MADIHLKKAHALAALRAGSFKGATGISPFKGSTQSAVAGLHAAATAHAVPAKGGTPSTGAIAAFKGAKPSGLKITAGIKGSSLPALALFGGKNRKKRRSKI